MFTSFLNSLKRPDNLSLIETIYKGYQTIFETKTNNWIKAYHGTNSEFDVFDENHFNTIEPKGDYTGSGFYFTNSKETAQKYAKQAVNKLGGKEIVKEVFLNIKNPFIINSKDDITKLNNLFHTVNSMADMPNLTEIEKNKLRDLGYERFKLIKENPKAVLDKFKSLGYDGIIDNLYGQIIVFSPNNIKSSPQDDKLISESIDVTFGKEPRGQTFDQITAYINGTNVARLVYELDFPIKGQINIELIETEPLYRKTGIATTLIQKLKEKYPDYQISGRSTNKIAEHLLKKTNVIDRTVQERKPVSESIDVYHGSGKSFSSFLMNKVGTGEGIQKFGYGLYFTESEEVAKYYANQAPKGSVIYKVTIPTDYATYVEWDNPIEPDIANKILTQAKHDKWKKSNIEDLMDDFGLSEGYRDDPGTFESVYGLIAAMLGGQKHASRWLLKAGIDGIKYKSGSLSGIDTSDFYNYVIFDQNVVKIKEKTKL